jgi:hypothetical protein
VVTDTIDKSCLPVEVYLPDSSGRSYGVRFSAVEDSVFVKDDSVIGVRCVSGPEVREYALVSLFAGGEFIVWPDSVPVRAEYTVYGSGMPVLESERGVLLRMFVE